MLVVSKLKRNFAILAIATICSKCIGFFREMLSAQQFGLSDNFDIYLSVFVVPSMITSLLLYAVPNVVIPKLKLNNNIDDRSFYSYFSSHFFWPYLLVLVLIVTVYNFFLNYYVGCLGLSNENFCWQYRLGCLLSLYIFFEAMFNMLTVLYNAKEKFVLPAFLHLILQSTVIISLLLSSYSIGVLSIVYGLAIGALVEFIVFLIFLRKQEILKYFKLNFSFTPHLLSSGIIILIIEFMGQLYSFADRIHLTKVPQGYIAGLYYANILKELPFVIFGVTLGGVLLPKITKMYQNQAYGSLIKLMHKILLNVFLLALCVALVLLFCGKWIVSFLFERGAFTPENSILTSKLLSLYALGLPFIFIHFLLIKLYYSVKLEKMVLITTSISILLKYILNDYFVSIEYYDGLALSTSIAFILNASILVLYYIFKLSSKLSKR